MPTLLHFDDLCCLARAQHKSYFHLLDIQLLYLLTFICHDNMHFFLVDIGIVLHSLTSPYELQLPCLMDHSQCIALLEFGGIVIPFVRCVLSAVPLQGLLQNRLAFLMKIKHSAFLFKIIFLKK